MEVKSIQQCSSPLNTLFFCDFNQNLLQKGIRQSFKNKTGISIDAGDHNKNVQQQVKAMNAIVIKTATDQIQTGVAQYIGYIQDIDTSARPMDRPVNTSTTGKKLPKSQQIGM
jgi:hypothetical protein